MKRYDMIEEQYKIIDNAIEIFKKKLSEELNEKMPLYASEWRKQMNEIVDSATMKK